MRVDHDCLRTFIELSLFASNQSAGYVGSSTIALYQWVMGCWSYIQNQDKALFFLFGDKCATAVSNQTHRAMCVQKKMAVVDEGGHFQQNVKGFLTFLLTRHDSQHTATFHSASLPMYRSSDHEYP
jgi:hypothetical protein